VRYFSRRVAPDKSGALAVRYAAAAEASSTAPTAFCAGVEERAAFRTVANSFSIPASERGQHGGLHIAFAGTRRAVLRAFFGRGLDRFDDLFPAQAGVFAGSIAASVSMTSAVPHSVRKSLSEDRQPAISSEYAFAIRRHWRRGPLHPRPELEHPRARQFAQRPVAAHNLACSPPSACLPPLARKQSWIAPSSAAADVRCIEQRGGSACLCDRAHIPRCRAEWRTLAMSFDDRRKGERCPGTSVSSPSFRGERAADSGKHLR